MPVSVTSTSATRVSRVRALHDRRAREESGRFLAEGPAIVRSALEANLVEELWATEPWLTDFPADVIATDAVMRAVAETQHPQGVLAVCRQPQWSLAEIWDAPGPVVYLDRIADPGNLGTIIRTGAAVGAAGVLLSPDSVDPFNGKVVRSSAGAICRVPVVPEVADLAGLGGRKLFATTPHGGISLFAADLTGQVCWLIGSEAHGLAGELSASADCAISIPMVPGTESLNAAVAAAVCLFTAFGDTP